jgi:predicted RNA-binding protein YlxR (DUF448 family)
VTAAAIERETDHDGARERRCIVTGEVLPEAALIRFVEGPEGTVVPDIAAKLPGRGMWIRADRQILEKAAAKNHFSRAARKPLSAPADLAARVEALIVQRMASDLGLARRAGALVLGFERISEALAGKSPPSVLVEASDGAKDGRRKLLGVASAHGHSPKVLDCLNSQELSLALGRENVVHAALKSGQLAERLDRNARRLAAIRAPETNKTKAGPTPAARRYE